MEKSSTTRNFIPFFRVKVFTSSAFICAFKVTVNKRSSRSVIFFILDNLRGLKIHNFFVLNSKKKKDDLAKSLATKIRDKILLSEFDFIKIKENTDSGFQRITNYFSTDIVACTRCVILKFLAVVWSASPEIFPNQCWQLGIY